MGKFDSLYKRLPVPAQHLAVSLYGIYWQNLRFGGNFEHLKKAYQRRNQFTCAQWNQYQSEQLRKCLSSAATNVPYYMDCWTATEKRAAGDGDLQGLPILEKEEVRRDPESFLNRALNFKSKLIFLTSGSTGTPISTIWDVDELRESMAAREVRSAEWAGVSFQLSRATFSGRMVEPDPNSNGPYYRYNAAEKQVYFSAFHLRPDTAQLYVDALKRHRVQWLTGYAVSFYLLAKFILERSISAPPVKAIITTSEKVTPEMRAVMEKAFGCRVYEEYSSVENVMFASECEYGRLHVSPEVGIVEILRSDGSHCEPGEVGEVVATSLIRHHQPLIRYRLGDLAAWDPEPCPCQRSMPVLKEVVGRIEDVLIGPDGRQMVRFHGVFTDQPNIHEGQIVQLALDKILVKVVPTKDFSGSDVEEVVRRVHQRMGVSVNVSVQTVNEIPRTKSGKFKAVVSLINNPNAE
jgi:phenylacetate-CoA ligase